MNPLIAASFAATTFALSAWLTQLFRNPGHAFYIPDRPNERSLHSRAIPRSGGLAMLLAMLVGGAGVAWFGAGAELVPVAFGVILIGGVSFLDDRYSVAPAYRLLAHVIAVAVLLYYGYAPAKLGLPALEVEWPRGVALAFSLLFGVWLINLYNFMDGMDGFAGGMSVCGFGAFAILGWLADHGLFSGMCLIIVSASAGFLVFNFPPARIFMGDVGSSVLGFLAAAFSLWGARDGIFPFWVAVLVFSPFIADASITLVRRLWRREKVWQAHKTHYYQQLVQAGWGHRKTVLAEYVIMLGCATTALATARAPAGLQALAVSGWVLFYALFFFRVSRFAARHGKPRVS